MEKIKWGVLGTASIARGCTIPGLKMADNAELYAIAGRDINKAETFKTDFGFEKAYGDYDSLINDDEVKAVYIPLPNDLHYEWCMKAIKAKKHVLCEKPLAPTAQKARELFEAAKENGVVLMEAFAYLHSPYVKALKEEIDNETIGKITYMESAFMVQSCSPTDIRMYREKFGGAFYDLGCYCTSMFTWLLGKGATEAKAIGDFSEGGIDLFSTAYLKFDDIRASINSGMIFGRNNCRMDRLYINGSRGYIKSEVEYNQSGDLSYEVCVDGVKTVKTVHADHNYKLEVEQLGRCILNGEKQHISPGFSVMNAATIDKVMEAMNY